MTDDELQLVQRAQFIDAMEARGATRQHLETMTPDQLAQFRYAIATDPDADADDGNTTPLRIRLHDWLVEHPDQETWVAGHEQLLERFFELHAQGNTLPEALVKMGLWHAGEAEELKAQVQHRDAALQAKDATIQRQAAANTRLQEELVEARKQLRCGDAADQFGPAVDGCVDE